MQQHDSSATAVSAVSCVVGIDVSKAMLDCYIDPLGRRAHVANDAAGIAKLVAEMG